MFPDQMHRLKMGTEVVTTKGEVGVISGDTSDQEMFVVKFDSFLMDEPVYVIIHISQFNLYERLIEDASKGNK